MPRPGVPGPRIGLLGRRLATRPVAPTAAPTGTVYTVNLTEGATGNALNLAPAGVYVGLLVNRDNTGPPGILSGGTNPTDMDVSQLEGSSFLNKAQTLLPFTHALDCTAATLYSFFDPIVAHGSVPVYSCNPTIAGSTVTYASIASGTYDTQITTFANAMAQYAPGGSKTTSPVIMRMWWEFNGSWGFKPPVTTVGGSTYTQQSLTDYAQAFQHVKTIFHNAGATNAFFAFTPNNWYDATAADNLGALTGEYDIAAGFGGTNKSAWDPFYSASSAINHYVWPDDPSYSPPSWGGTWVDIFGVDSYNPVNNNFQTFYQTIRNTYGRFQTANSSIPIYVFETGCGETGGTYTDGYSGLTPVGSNVGLIKPATYTSVDPMTKSQWFTDTFVTTLPYLSAIHGWMYYNLDRSQGQGSGGNYKIENPAIQAASGGSVTGVDANSTTAYANGIATSYYFTGPQYLPTAATDLVVSTKGYFRTASETLTLTDTIGRTQSLIRGLTTEALSTIDSSARHLIASRTLTETQSVVDSLARLTTSPRALTETLTTVANIARQAISPRPTSETLSTTDAPIRQITSSRGMTDSLSTLDALARQGATVRTLVTETVSTIDALARRLAGSRSISESLSLTDTVAKTLNNVRSIVESLSTGDVIGRVAAHVRGLPETIAVVDSVGNAFSHVGTFTVNLVDTLLVTDVPTRVANSGRAAAETVLTVATIVRNQLLPRGITESQSSVDSLARQATSLRIMGISAGSLLTNDSAAWKFDEGTGTTTSDATGNGATGTWNGTLGSQWGTGLIGSDGNYNGTDNYINVPDRASIRVGSGSWTIGVWVNPTSFGSTKYVLCKFPGGANSNGYFISVGATGGLSLFVGSTGGNTSWSPTLTLSTGSWQLIIFRYDTSTGLIYASINAGTEQSSAITAVQTDGVAPLTIGARPPSNFWTGGIDELNIWTRSLSSTERTALYNSGLGVQYPFLASGETLPTIDAIGRTQGFLRVVSEVATATDSLVRRAIFSRSPGVSASSLVTGIAAYWGFDDGSGSNAADATGNSRTGTWGGTLGSQWGTGKIGGCGVFNGSDNYVQTPGLTSGAAAASVSMWFNATNFTGSPGPCLFSDTPRSENVYALSSGVQANVFGPFINYNAGAGTLNTGTWYHLVVTYDGANGNIYINGTLRATAAGTGNLAATANNFIGNRGGLFTFFTGSIDEVGYWSRALTLAEVGTLYNSGAGFQYPFSVAGETLPTIDIIARLRVFGRSISETVSTVDSLARAFAALRSNSEVQATVDALSNAFSHAGSFTVNLADTLLTSDAVTRLGTWLRGLTVESVTSTDSVSRQGLFARLISESLSIVDAVARRLVATKSLLETLSTTDSTSRLAGFSRLLSDVLSTVDAVSNSFTHFGSYTVNLAETLSTSDIVVRLGTWLRSLPETKLTTDAIAKQQIFGRLISEVLSTVDTVGRTWQHFGAYTVTLVDNVLGSDALQRAMAWTRTAQQTLSTTDGLTRLLIKVVMLNENVATSDTVQRLATWVVFVQDTITTVDIVSRVRQFNRALTDSVFTSDTLARRLSQLRAVIEQVPILDAVANLLRSKNISIRHFGTAQTTIAAQGNLATLATSTGAMRTTTSESGQAKTMVVTAGYARTAIIHTGEVLL